MASSSSLKPDPTVERLIDLHKKLDDVIQDGIAIMGWRPLRFSTRGWLIADKIVDGEYQIKEFEPIGEWKKMEQYLSLEKELRSLLFSDLTPGQINAYRKAVGLAPINHELKMGKK